jgi:hypothetical protein
MPATVTVPADLTPLEQQIAALQAELAAHTAAPPPVATLPAKIDTSSPIGLHYDSSVDAKGCAKRPYSAALQFIDDNPANPMGGIFQILAHGPDDQCPAGQHWHICIYVPNPKAKNGRDHVMTIEAATAHNNYRPRISLGGGMFGAQVDFLDSTIYRKAADGSYWTSKWDPTKPAGQQESWVRGAPLLPV